MLSRFRRPIRMAQCLAVGVLACGALTFADTAQADSQTVTPGGMLSIPDRAYATEYGMSIPITYDWTPLPQNTYWRLELDETTSEMSVFDFGTSGGGGGTTNANWSPADLTGQHTLTGTLDLTIGEDPETTQGVALTTTIVRQPTTASIKATNVKPKVGRSIRIKGCVTRLGKRQAYEDVAVQYRLPGGSWRLYDAESTDSVGCYEVTMSIAKAGTRHVRVHVPPLHWAERAYSKTISIKVHK
jgi:hypothetical protein